MSDFINRTALLGYLSKKCAEKDYTTSDMLADIEKYGKNGEVSPLPTLPKEFEVLKNLRDYGGWGFRHYPLSKAEAETIEKSMAELKKYRDSGLTAEQLAQVDEEYLKVVQKVPRWRTADENPEKDGFYIAVLDGEICGANKPVVGMAEYENGKWVDDEPNYKCILAWQPLPEWEGGL
jgi:hypothetical protein